MDRHKFNHEAIWPMEKYYISTSLNRLMYDFSLFISYQQWLQQKQSEQWYIILAWRGMKISFAIIQIPGIAPPHLFFSKWRSGVCPSYIIFVVARFMYELRLNLLVIWCEIYMMFMIFSVDIFAYILSTYCVLATPYGDKDLCQLWLSYWIVAWRHQAVPWTNIDLPTVQSTAIHLEGTFISDTSAINH